MNFPINQIYFWSIAYLFIKQMYFLDKLHFYFLLNKGMYFIDTSYTCLLTKFIDEVYIYLLIYLSKLFI